MRFSAFLQRDKNLYVCVSGCVKEVSERVMSRAAGNTDVVNSNELSQLMHRQVDELQQLHAQNERLKVSM